MDEIELLLNVNNPLDRCRMASSYMDRHRVAMSRLATVRAKAILELRTRGHSAIELAGMLGITRQQVHRLLRDAVGKAYDSEAD